LATERPCRAVLFGDDRFGPWGAEFERAAARDVLRIAASIAGGTPVTLRDAIPGLDDRNLKLIITAIQHAAGHRPPHP
jgi:hypothetical protein